MAGLQIKKVLISDAVDEAAVNLLKEKGIHVDLQTALSRAQLLDKIKVSGIDFKIEKIWVEICVCCIIGLRCFDREIINSSDCRGHQCGPAIEAHWKSRCWRG